MNSQINKALRTIRNRNRKMVVLTKGGALRVHELNGSMYWRSIDAGWEWVGTYDSEATPEMVAEDLGVVA